jgi:hypothetical protein
MEKHVAKADFCTPFQRKKLVRDLGCLVEREEIVASSYTIGEVAYDYDFGGKIVEIAYEDLLRYAHIDLTAEVKPHDAPAEPTYCVLGFIINAPDQYLDTSLNSETEAHRILAHLADAAGHQFSYLYVFYSPNPGEHLNLEEAQKCFERATVSAGHSARRPR